MTHEHTPAVLEISDLEYCIRPAHLFTRDVQKTLWKIGALRIDRPGIVLLAGRNGCGKTTLIRCLMGLVKPTKGRISWFGAGPVPAEKVGYLPELPVLPARIKVREILSALLEQSEQELSDHHISALAASGLDISELLDRPAQSLSKGQQQRLLLSLAFLRNPMGFVLDEPFSGLDPWARTDLAELLVNLASSGRFLLISSHDAPRHLRNHVQQTWTIHKQSLSVTSGCALPE